MAKQLAYHVHVLDDEGNPHVYGPDDTVPGWAAKKITNPSAWVGADEADDTDDGDNGEAVPYAKWKKADLEAEVAKRNEGREDDDQIVVDGKGTVADLAAALEGDDVAQADNN